MAEIESRSAKKAPPKKDFGVTDAIAEPEKEE